MKNKTNAILSILFLAFFLIIIFGVSAFIVKTKTPTNIRTDAMSIAMNSQYLTATSTYNSEPTASFFMLSSDDSLEGGLYSISENNTATVLNFIEREPQYSGASTMIDKKIIPDTRNNITLNDKVIEEKGTGYSMTGSAAGARGTASQHDTTHYYFNQTRCDGIPIYGANLQVHVKDDSDGNYHVYSMSGAMTKEDANCTDNLSVEETESIALISYQKEYGYHSSESLIVGQSLERVYAPGIVDSSDQSESSLVQYVSVCDEGGFCHVYFVKKSDGTIVDNYSATVLAKNRSVCKGRVNYKPNGEVRTVECSSSSVTRKETDGPVSDSVLNKGFDMLGEIYDHYLSAHNRDSYDAQGKKIVLNIGDCNQIWASWSPPSMRGDNRIRACAPLVVLDVIAHEFQHAVTEYSISETSGLRYFDDSGALNESLSDVFASTVDDDDWTIGEDGIKTLRDMEDPHKSHYPQPRDMFDALYYCGTTKDNGGVHINNSIFNKAFFIMSDGETYPAINGCTIAGIGKHQAIQVVYRALTVYLKGKSTANYRDMYDAMLQACSDVYQSGSSECTSIKSAMEAVAMDQQTSGQAKAAICRNVSKKPLTCLDTPTPTSGPTGQPTIDPSTSPAISTTPTIELTPSPSVPTPTPTPLIRVETSLLSTLSSPDNFAGTVQILSDGTNHTITAYLTYEHLQSIQLEDSNRLGIANFNQAEGGYTGADMDDLSTSIFGRLVGEDVLETGRFVIRGDRLVNEFETQADLSRFTSYEVYLKESNNLSEVPLLLASINSEESEDTAEDKVVLDMKLRFQGIQRDPPSTQAYLVKIGVGGGDLDENIYKKAVFTPNQSGTWSGQVEFDIEPGDDYKILVKGPRHIQKRYCINTPSEASPGTYFCEDNNVVINKGMNYLDFTNVVQLSGDVDQNGVVNSFDISRIRSNIGSMYVDHLSYGDVNSDGVINAVDDSLVIYTLTNRTDRG